jgi:hypothetical protein
MTSKKTPDIGGAVRECLQILSKSLLDPYRPEQHYMRGPGPKWHALHALGASGAEPDIIQVQPSADERVLQTQANG